MEKESNPKGGGGERIPCDFCSVEIAVLFCRADSAKLCLWCDLHVHSANDLSRKHVRSQICDNCNSEPVSIRCSTDNLVLCSECDWDAHGNCSNSHDRISVEGFSGCPSPLELASVWGLDLGEKLANKSAPNQEDCNSGFSNWSSLDSILYMDSWINNSTEDLMVPKDNSNSNSVFYSNNKKQNPNCGKHKQLILKQLVQLIKNDLNHGDGDTTQDLSSSRSTKQGSTEELQVQGEMETNDFMQQLPYTSLLMSTVDTDLKGNVHLVEGKNSSPWGYNQSTNESSQIWDFNLGRSRDHKAHNQLEDGYETSDARFMIQSYTDLVKGDPLETTKALENMYGFNCSSTHHIKTEKHNVRKPASSQRPTKSESNNLPIPGSSSAKEINYMEQPLLKEENTRTTTKADMELLAQNRGNAMLRYKEKKRTRRFDKHIRYESRKARADTRKRVKGRFVKASEDPNC
ncbi:hypothetical protein ACHQM5_007714 [Ranunculus cassubicifolius]